MNDTPTTKAMRLIADSHEATISETSEHLVNMDITQSNHSATIRRLRNLADDLEGLSDAYCFLSKQERQKYQSMEIAENYSSEEAA